MNQNASRLSDTPCARLTFPDLVSQLVNYRVVIITEEEKKYICVLPERRIAFLLRRWFGIVVDQSNTYDKQTPGCRTTTQMSGWT